MSILSLTILLFTLFLIVLTTRYLPFLLPKKIVESQFAKKFEKVFPPGIIAFLVFYTLKDIDIGAFPHALPEILGIGAVMIMHIFFRNSLLSVFSGVATQQSIIYFCKSLT